MLLVGKLLFILSILLAVAGLTVIYWDKLKAICQKVLFTEKPATFKERLSILTGEINKHFFKRQKHEIKQTLAGTGRANWFGFLCFLSVLLGFLGVLLCVLFRNPFLLLALPAIGTLLPFLYIKLLVFRYKNKINTDLEDTLFALTYNYMTADHFIAVVRDNLELMPPTIEPFFHQLVTENTLISADVSAGIQNLKAKINNPVFHEWCDCVIQCQADSTLKGNLLPIVERLSDSHVIQHEVDTLIAGAKRNAYYVLGLVSCCPLVFKLVPEWFAVYSTNQGKFAIAVSFIIILFSVWRINRLSQPIQLEEAK